MRPEVAAVAVRRQDVDRARHRWLGAPVAVVGRHRHRPHGRPVVGPARRRPSACRGRRAILIASSPSVHPFEKNRLFRSPGRPPGLARRLRLGRPLGVDARRQRGLPRDGLGGAVLAVPQVAEVVGEVQNLLPSALWIQRPSPLAATKGVGPSSSTASTRIGLVLRMVSPFQRFPLVHPSSRLDALVRVARQRQVATARV